MFLFVVTVVCDGVSVRVVIIVVAGDVGVPVCCYCSWCSCLLLL